MFPNSVEDVFAEVKPILRSALDGHNVCIFAHGQTGTGKTFTMVSDRNLKFSGCCSYLVDVYLFFKYV